MTHTLTTRLTAIIAAAAIVTLAWLPTVTVPLTATNATYAAAVA